jgi:NAD(P)-dependent dehydrogenase (short-subunit alcohol dehydrogenase family)
MFSSRLVRAPRRFCRAEHERSAAPSADMVAPIRGLRDKVVIVAGGASGIGAATALRLAEEGAAVVVGDLDQDGAALTAAGLRARGATAVATGFDIADEMSCKRLVEFACAELGGLDGLFNVAADVSPATLGRDTDILTIPTEVWQRTLDVNLTGTFFMARQAIPALLTRGGGSIVNTLSGLVVYGDPMRPAYGASKAGLMALTKHIAARFGKQNVRCNAVAPGYVMTDQAARNIPPETRQATLAATKLPRLGTPDDIAATVAFLLSDDAGWITSQLHLVNGGK